jgi:membrane protein YdbS with pleckstrin-like domain
MTDPAREATRLSPRLIELDRAIGRITTAVVALFLIPGAVVSALTAGLPFWLDVLVIVGAAALCVVIGWHLHRWPPIDYAHASYTVDPEGLVVRRGVLWRHVISVPRSRVQHTDVSQGPIERRYGLGTIVIYTAGTEHAEVPLRGVEYDTAIAIRDLLLPQHRHDVV